MVDPTREHTYRVGRASIDADEVDDFFLTSVTPHVAEAITHFRDALNEVREELVLYLMATAFLMYFASAGIYYFERDVPDTNFQSIFHSMWWAVVTLTTVGYGDVYPQTTGGKIFTGFILLIGLSVIAIPSGLIASGMTKVKEKHD
ncbi:MAG: two pore domain potassium channel family protein [Planctomycetes bacterium]|nr:two pore domain potassium channel family protein [Planctomycetota bacterium]